MCSIQPDTCGSHIEYDTVALLAVFQRDCSSVAQESRLTETAQSWHAGTLARWGGGGCSQRVKAVTTDSDLMYNLCLFLMRAAGERVDVALFFMVNICFSFAVCVLCGACLLHTGLVIFLRLAWWAHCFSLLTVFESEFQAVWWGLVWEIQPLPSLWSCAKQTWLLRRILVQTSLRSCFSR